MNVKAVLWDVDGTIAETERDGHRVAFNRAFVACGLPWHWSEERYGCLLAITGGRERLLRDMCDRPDAPQGAEQREALARRVHEAKNSIYPDLLRQVRLPLRDGVMHLMTQCRSRGVRMGIATTTSRACVTALLQLHLGDQWRDWFQALVCGEDVQRKKPDPQVYVRALRELRASPSEVVAIEDSPAGAAAARAADLAVVLTRSSYFQHDDIHGAVAVGPGLHQRRGWEPGVETCGLSNGQIGLADIDHWVSAARADT
ncbi:MAG: HAD-IA family hydrolase [Betaproteobacteria bacterium]